MSGARLTASQIIRISPWKKFCGRSCLADFVISELLEDNLSDAAVDRLCDMFGRYYGIKDVKKQNLIEFFKQVYPSPYDWQVIVGLVFDEEINRASRGLESPINSDDTMSYTGFDSIARQLDFSVQFYGEAKDKNGIDLLPGYPELNPRQKRCLRVYYSETHRADKTDTEQKVGHYDRFADSMAEAVQHNAWESKVNTVNELDRDNRDPGVMKKQVRQSFESMQKGSQKKSNVQPVLPKELAHILTVKEVKKLPKGHQQTIRRLFDAGQIAEANAQSKELAKSYESLYGSLKKETIRLFSTKSIAEEQAKWESMQQDKKSHSQEALDHQYAMLLQAQEYSNKP